MRTILRGLAGRYDWARVLGVDTVADEVVANIWRLQLARQAERHQRGPGGGGLGEDVTTGAGPIASDCGGGSRWLRWTAAAAAETATISKSHHPARFESTSLSQRLPGTCGGVIARVRISTRQKLNRPLRSMSALTSGQPLTPYQGGKHRFSIAADPFKCS